MRVGIVSNDNQQVSSLLEEFPGHEVLWAAGTELADEFKCPVYEDYAEAMADRIVDIIIDCTGDVEDEEVMVVDAEAAHFLLGAGRRFLGTGSGSGHSSALAATAGQLSSGIEKIVQRIGVLDDYSKKLSEIGAQLDSASKGIVEDLERTGRILDSITRIAKRSKIIGLNSAIEAARVGEQGRGFAIVAEEIKTLADDSSQSVQDIEKILAGIERRSDEFSQRTDTVHDVTDLQLQTTSEIASMLQALKELGQHLRALSEQQSS